MNKFVLNFNQNVKCLNDIITESIKNKHANIRKGQQAFNIAYDLFPKYADMIRSTVADPFYNDSVVNDFIIAVATAMTLDNFTINFTIKPESNA